MGISGFEKRFSVADFLSGVTHVLPSKEKGVSFG
jgi:hypothetical protein